MMYLFVSSNSYNIWYQISVYRIPFIPVTLSIDDRMNHEYPISPNRVESDATLCEYCGLPLSETGESESEFCSDTCQSAHEYNGATLPEYTAETFYYPGVNAIDASMPQGMPRDTLNLVSGEAGTRMHALLMEIAWRALQRDEPVVLVCVSDPPIAALRQFLSLQWNIIPHLESGRLRLIDCYTHRETGDYSDSDPVQGIWGAHLQEATQSNDAITFVHDPTQPNQFRRHLCQAADELEMNCNGTIIFDSLTELGTLMREIQGYELLKNLRANFAKNRAITLFCGSHYGGYNDEFPHQLEYLFDGVIDLSLNPQLLPGHLIKQLLVRKMQGVMTLREQYSYEFMEREGLTLLNLNKTETQPDAQDSAEDTSTSQTVEIPQGQRHEEVDETPTVSPMNDGETSLGSDTPPN